MPAPAGAGTISRDSCVAGRRPARRRPARRSRRLRPGHVPRPTTRRGRAAVGGQRALRLIRQRGARVGTQLGVRHRHARRGTATGAAAAGAGRGRGEQPREVRPIELDGARLFGSKLARPAGSVRTMPRGRCRCRPARTVAAHGRWVAGGHGEPHPDARPRRRMRLSTPIGVVTRVASPRRAHGRNR